MNLLGEWVKRSTKVYGLNPKFQALADFEITISWLTEIIPKRHLPTKNMRPLWMRYSSIKDFRDLCFDLCKELAIHADDGSLKSNEHHYLLCQASVKNCIKLFEGNQLIMDFNMELIAAVDDKYYTYRKNWYLLVYEELQIVDNQFDFKLRKKNTFSHRENAFAHLLKVDFENIDPIPRKEQKPKKLEQAFDSLNPKTKNNEKPYKQPNKKELTNVIILLEKFPNAKAEAERLLNKVIESIK